MLGRMLAWSAFVVWLRRYWQKSIWFAPAIVAVSSVVVITFAHHEYLEFAEASQTTRHVALSFVVKWVSIVVVFLAALSVIFRNRKRKVQSATLATKDQSDRTESPLPHGVDLDRPRSAAERILDESPSRH